MFAALLLFSVLGFIAAGPPLLLLEESHGTQECDDATMLTVYPFSSSGTACLCPTILPDVPCTAVHHVSPTEAVFEPCADRPTCLAGGCPSASGPVVSYDECRSGNATYSAAYRGDTYGDNATYPFIEYFESSGLNCTGFHKVEVFLETPCSSPWVGDCAAYVIWDRWAGCANVTSVLAWADELPVVVDSAAATGDSPVLIVAFFVLFVFLLGAM